MKSTLRITLVSFLILFFIPNLTSAETKTFIKEYTYQASEVDSKVSCRAISLEQVKRLLLDELGTYLESYTEIVNFKLTKDQITALTAGIVQTQVVKEKWNGERYWIQAEIKADPDEVVKAVDSLRKDRQKSKELEDANKRAEAALREVERLRKELELAKKDQTKIARYDEAIKELSAIDWLRKGLSLSNAGDYQGAISADTKAIQLDPKNSLAYVLRGINYYLLGNYQKALEDSNRAVELDPRMAEAYVVRGSCYSALGNDQQAIDDSNKAIELDPKDSFAYVIRGDAYSNLGNMAQATSNYKIAARLGDKNSQNFLKSNNISW